MEEMSVFDGLHGGLEIEKSPRLVKLYRTAVELSQSFLFLSNMVQGYQVPDRRAKHAGAEGVSFVHLRFIACA